jgi:hypothetical protein
MENFMENARGAADLRGDSAGLQARSFLTGTIILLRC